MKNKHCHSERAEGESRNLTCKIPRLLRNAQSLGMTGVFLIFLSIGSVFSEPAGMEQKLVSEVAALERTEFKNGEPKKLASFLKKALQSYGTLRDYKAIFNKTEPSEGVLGAREKIFLKFEKPWKIYMGWLNTDKKGLQVVYERGKHDNKLVIHKPGLLLGLAPVIFLDQNSPWVREGSASYNIEDAGIGTFLYDFTKAILKAGHDNKLEVRFQGKTRSEGLNGEKVEVTFLNAREDADYFAHRIVTVFDEKSALPVYMELFDHENRTKGIYSYENLQIDAGASDPEFKKQINRHLLRVYENDTVVRR